MSNSALGKQQPMAAPPASGASTSARDLDRPLTNLLRLSGEQALYVLFMIVALGMRLWGLGARAMSHDESLHALFSWKLYNGEGYVHDPMMHGPFLFHANAVVYFLFGVSDFTARLVPALFGTALVGLPYLLRRWLGRAGALCAAFFLLVGPSFLYYSRYIRNDIYICVWSLLLAWALFRYVEEGQRKHLVLGAAFLSLSIATKEVAFITLFIGATFVALAALWESLSRGGRLYLQVGVAALGAGLLVAVALLRLALAGSAAGTMARMAPHLNFAALLLISAALATLLLPDGSSTFLQALRRVDGRALYPAIGVFLAIYVLLFTTFFTNPRGLFTGSIGAVAYWLAQQPVQRGSQPWYYYFFLMPFYELVPFFIGLPGVAYLLLRALRRRLGTRYGEPYWLAFLVYWSLLALVIYSWAGEKMPWLLVHLALPLLLVAAQLIGRWLEREDWRAWLGAGGLLSCLYLFLLLIAIALLLLVRPFRGLALRELEATGRWLLSAGAAIVLLWLLWGQGKRLGRAGILNSARAVLLVMLSLFTVRFAWAASYVNYDYVNEFLVYAHGSPDIKVVMLQLEEISRRVAGDKELVFSYDQEDVWPLEWYFKDYPNRIFYGSEPTKAAMEAPVVFVNDDNEAKAKPFLGDRYYRFTYRLVWWPIEDYKGLTPGRIWQVLRDGQRLRKWLTIWFYRRYPIPYSAWPYQNRFALYVRKDILNQMWDLGVTMAIPSEMPRDPYQEVWQERPASLVVGQVGKGPGQFVSPRGLAVAPDGRVYVVDSGNARIQVLDEQGQYLFGWGQAGQGPGQFTEPWGIAIAPNGDVYVADTWNHRIQWFDAQGNFKGMWGYFADTRGDVAAQPGGFWGPRDVVVAADGTVYVTDTGNKRVQRFSADGHFLAAYGTFHEGDRFDEPVGIALDPEGRFYIADTWNRRILIFNSHFEYEAEWPIRSWEGQSLVNKPYLAADEDYVYAADPEGYRILVFDKSGQIRLTFGRYGADAAGMNLPTGVALDPKGRLWVTDTQNNRLLRFDRPRP